jgi:hypothetical protein
MLLISVAYRCDLQPVAQGFRQTLPRSMALATHVSGSWGVNGRWSAGTEGWDRGSGASLYPYVSLRSPTYGENSHANHTRDSSGSTFPLAFDSHRPKFLDFDSTGYYFLTTYQSQGCDRWLPRVLNFQKR